MLNSIKIWRIGRLRVSLAGVICKADTISRLVESGSSVPMSLVGDMITARIHAAKLRERILQLGGTDAMDE